MKTICRNFPPAICLVLFLATACEESSVELPDASFTPSTDLARVGETIHFQNNSMGADNFEWDFGDGNVSNEENPSHIYSEVGSYAILLKSGNSKGTDEASESILISSWSKKENMPTKRWLQSSSVVEGKIYVIGGGFRYGRGALSTVEEYDPKTGQWSSKADMPTARQGLSTSVVNGKIYAIAGGESPKDNTYSGIECYTIVEEYDPATDTWTTKASIPQPRFVHSSAVVNGKIYIIGGSNSFPFSDVPSIMMYDPATDTWNNQGGIPRPMICSGSAVVNGIIYVFGGDLSGNGQRVDAYNPVTNTWTPKANMPTSRDDFSCCVWNNKIYAIGGEITGGDYTGTMEIYDPSTDLWTKAESMIIPRCGHSTSVLDGKIYVTGGIAGLISTLTSLEVYYE